MVNVQSMVLYLIIKAFALKQGKGVSPTPAQICTPLAKDAKGGDPHDASSKY